LDSGAPGEDDAVDPRLFFGRRRMKRLFSLCSIVAMVFLLLGCGPEESLFPLFTRTDTLLDQKLLGEWRIWNGKEVKAAEKPAHIVFSPSASGDRYEVRLTELNAEGATMVSEAHLVKLGDCLFIDFGTPNMDNWRQVPYPAAESHVFGRLFLEKDQARIDLLSDDWVKKQIDAGKLPLRFLPLSGDTLSANTEELRKFAMEHAADQEVFSETFNLVRNMK
jgi:hypothetical protein